MRATAPNGEIEIAAKLVVGADGRHSTDSRHLPALRSKISARRWTCCGCASPKHPGDPTRTARLGANRAYVVLLDRGDYWQCAYLIAKGSFERSESARESRRCSADSPKRCRCSRDRVAELDDWSKVAMLDVRVDRLAALASPRSALHRRRRARDVADRRHRHQSGDSRRGRNGKYPVRHPLRAGADAERRRTAAHPRSPNVSDEGDASVSNVRARSRDRAAHARQAQLRHRRCHARLFDEFPLLRRLPARLIGIGVRPEHVHTPDAYTA